MPISFKKDEPPTYFVDPNPTNEFTHEQSWAVNRNAFYIPPNVALPSPDYIDPCVIGAWMDFWEHHQAHEKIEAVIKRADCPADCILKACDLLDRRTAPGAKKDGVQSLKRAILDAPNAPELAIYRVSSNSHGNNNTTDPLWISLIESRKGTLAAAINAVFQCQWSGRKKAIESLLNNYLADERYWLADFKRRGANKRLDNNHYSIYVSCGAFPESWWNDTIAMPMFEKYNLAQSALANPHTPPTIRRILSACAF